MVADDPRAFRVALAEVVRLARAHALEQHLERRAQEHDRVEPVVEPHLIPHAALEEQCALGMSGEERLDPRLDPQALRPAVGKRRFLAPARVVGVDHAVPSALELDERRRLPGAGHPGDEDDRHGSNLALPERGSPRVRATDEATTRERCKKSCARRCRCSKGRTGLPTETREADPSESRSDRATSARTRIGQRPCPSMHRSARRVTTKCPTHRRCLARRVVSEADTSRTGKFPRDG